MLSPKEMTSQTIKFKPAIDASTWSLIALIVAVCGWPLFLSPDWVTALILAACIVICIIPFFSIRYEVDGEDLVVYQFFKPSRFPIMKIGVIEPTKSLLSAPATSLTRRIAISFTDRKVLKSAMPIIISPADTGKFINTFVSINPEIKVKQTA